MGASTMRTVIITALVMAAAVGSPARAATGDCGSHALTLSVTGMGSSQTTYDLFKSGSWTITAYYAVGGGSSTALPLAITSDGGRGLLTFSGTTSVPTPTSPYTTTVTWKFVIRSASTVILDSGPLGPLTLPNAQPCATSDNAFVYKPVLTLVVVEDVLGTGDVSIFDPGLPGWTITATHGAEAVQAVTDDTGTATVALDPLIDWSVCQVPRMGWAQTYPANAGCYAIGVRPGDMDALIFGDRRALSVAMSATGTVIEGGTWATDGSFVDLESTTWTATVDYGDGSGAQPLSLIGTTFALSHRYLDNGSFTVQVVVTNGQGRTGMARGTAVIRNVAPAVQLTAPQPGALFLVNAPVTFAATFTDAGVLDTHRGAWVFTIGRTTYTVPATISESGGGGTATATFSFPAPGAYFVSLVVTDKDGGSRTATMLGGSKAFVVIYAAGGMDR